MLSLSEKALLTGSWWIIVIPGVFLGSNASEIVTEIGNAVRKRANRSLRILIARFPHANLCRFLSRTSCLQHPPLPLKRRVLSDVLGSFVGKRTLLSSDWSRILIPQANIPPNKQQAGGSHMDNMFCYQCEQTAGCSGCTGSRGVCGKTADVANLQDVLTGALIGLARATTNAQPTKGHLAFDDQRPVYHAHQRQFQRRGHRKPSPAASTKKHAVWSRTAAAARIPVGTTTTTTCETLVRAGGHPQPQVAHSLRRARHGRICPPRLCAGL